MAAHAPATVEADDARTALFRKLEYFPSAPWSARAGGELIQALDQGPWWAWDPACGEGHMAHGLGDYFAAVQATDIFEHGGALASCAAGGSLQHGGPLDFLSAEADAVDQTDWIVTNPPFSLGAAFVETGLRRAARGVAVLARSGWLDSGRRYPLFFGGETLPPCDFEFPFFDRVAMSLGRWEASSAAKGGSSATPYSWFVWMKPVARPDWLRATQAMVSRHLPLQHPDASGPIAGMTGHALLTVGIPPGTRARLTRPEDARMWGARGPMALFGSEAGGGWVV